MSVARVLLCQRVLETIWTREPQNIKHHTGIHANCQSHSYDPLSSSHEKRVPTKIFSQSRDPDGLYRPIPISIIQCCLSRFPTPRRAISVGDDFLLKSLVTVRSMLVSFHQNDDIVHFRSFQSIARIAYALDTVTTSFR